MFEAIILGLIQGIAEWLPVSSEGMISLFLVNFMGYTLKDAVVYAIWLHMGTFFSALVYFYKDILSAFKDLKFKRDSLFWFVCIGTVCSLVIGGPLVLFGLDHIDAGLASGVIGLMLLITGIVQLRIKKSGKSRKLDVKDSILVGIGQGFSAMPGISRSGTTTAILLMQKYKAFDALRISFIMSIPLVLISTVYLGVTEPTLITIDSFIALVVAFVTGLIGIKVLMKVAEKINFGLFCIVMGILAIIAIFI